MDTNKMCDISREQFEAAFAEETVRRAIENGLLETPEEPAELAACTVYVMSKDRDGDTYHHEHFASAWWAWQASREAVVVELPKLNPEMFQFDVIFGHDKARKEARAAIEAQGLKVAP